jgi:hypothetical protein
VDEDETGGPARRHDPWPLSEENAGVNGDAAGRQQPGNRRCEMLQRAGEDVADDEVEWARPTNGGEPEAAG